TAADFEGADAAPAPDATTAIARAGGGCTDTDSNTSDFSTIAAAPINSTAPASPCSGGGGPSSAFASASVRLQIQSVIAIALGQPTLDFGGLVAGATAPPVSENGNGTSNDTAGYTLTAHRSAFSPRDLPLGLSATAPTGGFLCAGISPTVLAARAIAPC